MIPGGHIRQLLVNLKSGIMSNVSSVRKREVNSSAIGRQYEEQPEEITTERDCVGF